MADTAKTLGLRMPPKGTTYVYDFKVNGERYNRSTKTANYREALKRALAVKAEAEGFAPRKTPLKPDITLDAAFLRFYEERGHTYARPNELLGLLAHLAEALGPDTLLSQLSMDVLLRYQTQLRAKGRSNRTLNKLQETLRPIVKQARQWGVNLGEIGSGEFDWSVLRHTLPAHRTRAADRREQALLLIKTRKDYRPVIYFALLTGLRRNAVLLNKSQIDWQNHSFRYRKKSRKRDNWVSLPMTPAIERLLKAECAKAPDQDAVFTYICERGNKGQKKGQRYPITPAGWRRVMARAVEDAGLKDWRGIHDLRHTAATEVLRATQNLALVQRMLGHEDIAQTSRYAHVMVEDVREGMAMRRRQSRENHVKKRDEQEAVEESLA